MSRRFTLITLAAVAAIVAAGCTDIAFNVTKETTGDVAPSGPFEVEVTCDATTETLQFNGPYPESVQSQDFDLDDSVDCTLVETDPANAVTTTMDCADPIPAGVTCTPTADGLEVHADEVPGPSEVIVQVTVTNDLGTTTTTAPTTTTTVDPNALNVIVAAPSFTG